MDGHKAWDEYHQAVVGRDQQNGSRRYYCVIGAKMLSRSFKMETAARAYREWVLIRLYRGLAYESMQASGAGHERATGDVP